MDVHSLVGELGGPLVAVATDRYFYGKGEVMASAVIYPCKGSEDARRAVYGVLFQSMRWNYWYEIADALRYVDINRVGIDRALIQLVERGTVERMVAGDGRYIYRVTLTATGR